MDVVDSSAAVEPLVPNASLHDSDIERLDSSLGMDACQSHMETCDRCYQIAGLLRLDFVVA